MREASFFRKNSVRLSYVKLRFAAVLYAAVPVAVFLLGWLKPWWGVPAAALLAAGVLCLRPGKKGPAALQEKALCVPAWVLAAMLAFALIWCFWGGQGGYFYQNTDFANRNGVLHDLVNYPWPVYYQSSSGGFGNHGEPFALVYYICHWLLPALAGKAVLAATGAAGAAWLAANFALFLWTSLGVFLVLCLLVVTLRPQGWLAVLLVCVGFMAFSGLDIVGTAWMHQDVGFHIERWAGTNEYSSMTTCLFWVFNQTVVPWLMTLCVMNEKGVENYALLGLLALPFGPLPFVGLAVMCLGLGAVRLVQSVRAGRLPAFWREVFSRQNLLVLAAVLPVFYLYFSSNAATTMEEGRFCFYLSGRQEVDAGKELFELVRFYMLECGVYLALIWHDYKKDALFYLTAASLMAYPLFRMGAAGTGDFTMRASIPALLVLACMVLGYLVRRKSVFRTGKAWERALYILLVAALCVGAVTPLVELWHGFIVVWNAGHFGIAYDPYGTVNHVDNVYINNFVSWYLQDSPFFRFFSVCFVQKPRVSATRMTRMRPFWRCWRSTR